MDLRMGSIEQEPRKNLANPGRCGGFSANHVPIFALRVTTIKLRVWACLQMECRACRAVIDRPLRTRPAKYLFYKVAMEPQLNLF